MNEVAILAVDLIIITVTFTNFIPFLQWYVKKLDLWKKNGKSPNLFLIIMVMIFLAYWMTFFLLSLFVVLFDLAQVFRVIFGRGQQQFQYTEYIQLQSPIVLERGAAAAA